LVERALHGREVAIEEDTQAPILIDMPPAEASR
jgi:hypothetical protein